MFYNVKDLHKASKEVIEVYKNYGNNVQTYVNYYNMGLYDPFQIEDFLSEAKKDLNKNLDSIWEKYQINEDKKQIVLTSAQLILREKNNPQH